MFQFMRCFEDHHVVAFEDLKNSDKAVPIHKPIFCTTHPTENLKFFCYTCQVRLLSHLAVFSDVVDIVFIFCV